MLNDLKIVIPSDNELNFFSSYLLKPVVPVTRAGFFLSHSLFSLNLGWLTAP